MHERPRLARAKCSVLLANRGLHPGRASVRSYYHQRQQLVHQDKYEQMSSKHQRWWPRRCSLLNDRPLQTVGSAHNPRMCGSSNSRSMAALENSSSQQLPALLQASVGRNATGALSHKTFATANASVRSCEIEQFGAQCVIAELGAQCVRHVWHLLCLRPQAQVQCQKHDACNATDTPQRESLFAPPSFSWIAPVEFAPFLGIHCTTNRFKFPESAQHHPRVPKESANSDMSNYVCAFCRFIAR
jgi:hypothetical protein